MTNEEFNDEIEKLGLFLGMDMLGCYFFVNGENKSKSKDEAVTHYAAVSRGDLSKFNIEEDFHKLSDKKQRKLLNLLKKYSLTPIQERYPKHYFKYHLKNFLKDGESDSYNIEWLNFREKTKTFHLSTSTDDSLNKTIFEENDSLLDIVDLGMFTKIEVDKQGNVMENKENKKTN